jgi:hypothetical protein
MPRMKATMAQAIGKRADIRMLVVDQKLTSRIRCSRWFDESLGGLLL